MGPGPDRRAALSSSPSVARASDVRRARVAGRKQRGGIDRWAMAQCRVAVPLTGGSGLRPKRSGRALMNSMVLYLFELV
jgi:hypothetical protein